MVMIGETVASAPELNKCFDCQQPLRLRVMRSNAGWYVGFGCEIGQDCKLPDGSPGGGSFGEPHSRESGYYATQKEAELALESGDFGREPY